VVISEAKIRKIIATILIEYSSISRGGYNFKGTTAAQLLGSQSSSSEDININVPEGATHIYPLIKKHATITSPPQAARQDPTGQSKKVVPHRGYDFGCPTGSPVFSVASGKVVKIINSNKGSGNQVIVSHDYAIVGNHSFTHYCHLSSITARQGQSVSAGTLVGKSGGAPGSRGAGTSTGPHLHFAIASGKTFKSRSFNKALYDAFLATCQFATIGGGAIAQTPKDASGKTGGPTDTNSDDNATKIDSPSNSPGSGLDIFGE